LEQDDAEHNENTRIQSCRKHHLFGACKRIQPQHAKHMRQHRPDLFVRELSLNTINEAVAIDDLSNDDDGMEHQDQKPQPRRTEHEADNGSGSQQLVPE